MAKSASQAINCDNSATVLAADPYIAIELSYYLSDCQVSFYSPWPTLSGGYAPLSGSPLQVKDPANQLRDAKRIVLVYYGNEPSLQLPNMLTATSTQSFQNMKVTTYTQ